MIIFFEDYTIFTTMGNRGIQISMPKPTFTKLFEIFFRSYKFTFHETYLTRLKFVETLFNELFRQHTDLKSSINVNCQYTILFVI